MITFFLKKKEVKIEGKLDVRIIGYNSNHKNIETVEKKVLKICFQFLSYWLQNLIQVGVPNL